MRKLLKLLCIAVLMVWAGVASAQEFTAASPKFGHIDMSALIPVMPEYTAAMDEMNNFVADMEDVLSGMQQEYQTKMTEYENLYTSGTASEVALEAKVQELTDSQTRIQNYQNDANTKITNKQNQLLQPIYEKANTAISEVADAQELIYVFDISAGVLLYFSNESLDLLPLVKAKLGLQ